MIYWPTFSGASRVYVRTKRVSTIKVPATSKCKSAFHGLRPFISHQIQHILFKDISISWHEEAEDSWHEACMSLRPSMKFVVEHDTRLHASHLCKHLKNLLSPLCSHTELGPSPKSPDFGEAAACMACMVPNS